ncbi:hypothetical protein, partial [Rhodococcoides corynebacterioides]|uniref:hypothetical protein n=1 Tax=Rhodococcoides corynebacterioides TaxID=53972 RepID=UPI001C9AD409
MQLPGNVRHDAGDGGLGGQGAREVTGGAELRDAATERPERRPSSSTGSRCAVGTDDRGHAGAVGSDHLSVNQFQQQVTIWGDTATLMNPVTANR